MAGALSGRPQPVPEPPDPAPRGIVGGDPQRGRLMMREACIRGNVSDMTKRVFIKTYGCQMNVYDSARMAELLAPLGFAPAKAPDDADLVILNTCHIREKAAEKVYSELGKIRRLKRRKRAAAAT